MNHLKSSLVLRTLQLQDFATFKQQSISFTEGFNAIVGETGSGKSLILDALQFILGQRADKKFIRKGATFAIIEATFSSTQKEVYNFFNELGFPFEEEIVIKRVIYSNGKSKSFLNNLNCPLSTLTDFSRNFIDLVGQFENQKLLSNTYQLELLDKFAGLPVKEYSAKFFEYKSLFKKLIQLQTKEQENQNRIDYLNFQIEELNNFEPSSEDEKNLNQQKNKLLFQQQNQESITHINALFDGDDSQLGFWDILNKIKNLIPEGTGLKEKLDTAKEELEDINYQLNKLNDEDFEPEQMTAVIDRLDGYQKLKHKFRCETLDFDNVLQGFSSELSTLLSYEQEIQTLNSECSSLKEELYLLASKLHTQRANQSTEFQNELTKEVQALRMDGATIKVSIEKTEELSSQGLTQVQLLAETNKGEGFYPIKDIASGGELSRILLSVRKIIADSDSIGIFLFDEIDTGIGGETALHVGKALSKVSQNSQVLAITHLPQIANFANKLIIVDKKTDKDRTWSEIKEATSQEIKKEISLMTPLQ